jgi:hypothetical protein
MSKNSIAVSPFTMPAALAAADGLLGDPTGSSVWTANPDNPGQVAWLETFRRRANTALGMPEVHRNATTSSADHVAWLKAEGWDAQIAQGGPGDLFLASTINIVAKWQETGRAYKHHSGVHRVTLKKGATVIRQPSAQPIVRVATQHPDYVFVFQQIAPAPASAQELLSIATETVASAHNAFEEVHLDFPQVDLRVKNDARYMVGLRSGPNVVTQAAEQLRLELNEIGGRASAAAEVAVSRGFIMGPKTVYIEGPFMVAVVRAHSAGPDNIAFAAYVDRDSWMRPADGRI